MEHRLGQVRSVVMGFLEGRLESLMEEEREEGTTESSDSLEAEMLGASGNRPDNQDGGEDSVVDGVFCPASMRRDSPLPREEGLIMQMEREAVEAGLGGGSTGIRRTSWRAGVVLTPTLQPVRIKFGQLS